MATLCLRSWFLWWNHVSRESSFLHQKTLALFPFWRKKHSLLPKKTETHKKAIQYNKNKITPACNKRLAPLWVRFYFGKFTLKIKFGYICDVSGKMPQRQAKRRDVTRNSFGGKIRGKNYNKFMIFLRFQPSKQKTKLCAKITL